MIFAFPERRSLVVVPVHGTDSKSRTHYMFVVVVVVRMD